MGNAPGDFLASDIHRMGATIKINTIALFNTTHAFLPDMLASKRGHVVTVASAASFLQCPSAVDYTVSKVSDWTRAGHTMREHSSNPHLHAGWGTILS